MQPHRPSPLLAGVTTILLACALLASPALASETAPDLAEIQKPETTSPAEAPAEPAYRAALSDALSGEAQAFAAFAQKQKRLTAPAAKALKKGTAADPRDPSAEASLAAIQSLHGADVEVSESLDGARQVRKGEQLLASLGGVVDAQALEAVEVDESSESWRCLAEAMYFEARGEGLAGQIAVGEVILNRVDSSRYPDSVCEVVSQGSGNGTACQFSYHCDGLDNRINDMLAWDQVGRVAALMLGGRPRILTDDALYFHNTSVRPSWAKKFVRTARIGQHVFYRPEVQLSMR